MSDPKTDDKLKTLIDLNTSIKQFNTLLEELIQSRQKDKLEWLRAVNTDLQEVNTILANILESREKDSIRNELNHTTQ